MSNPLADVLQSLTDQIQSWFERTPRAQRAYEKLSADLESVGARVAGYIDENESLKGIRDKVAATIDPPAAPAPPTPAAEAASDAPIPPPGAPASGTAQPGQPAPSGPAMTDDTRQLPGAPPEA